MVSSRRSYSGQAPPRLVAASSRSAAVATAGTDGGGNLSFPRAYGEDVLVGVTVLERELLMRVCGAIVGGRRVCLEKVVEGKRSCAKHEGKKNKKYFPPTESAWHINAKPMTKGGPDSVFVSPYRSLEESLPDHRSNLGSGNQLVTQDWVGTFEDYRREYARTLEDLEEEEDEESEEDSEEDEGSVEVEEDAGAGTGEFADLLDSRVPNNEDSFPRAQTRILPSLKFGEDIDASAVNGPAIQATRNALELLESFMDALADDAPDEGLRAVEYLRPLIAQVATAVNKAIEAIASMSRSVGDITSVYMASGHTDMCTAITAALEQGSGVGDFAGLANSVKDLKDSIGDLEEKLQDEMVRSGQISIDLIQGCMDRIAEAEGNALRPHSPRAHSRAFAGPTAAITAIPRTAVIMEDDGVTPIISLAELIKGMRLNTTNQTALEARVRKLEADVMANGGVVFAGRSYSSEDEVRSMVRRNYPDGKGLAAFVIPTNMSAHEAAYSPGAGWRDEVKAAAKDGHDTAEQKFMFACTQRLPYHHSKGGKVQPGKKLSALASTTAWDGLDGLNGNREMIDESLDSAETAATTYIQRQLRAGTEMLKLAEKMLDSSRKWYTMLHRFLDHDCKQLIELKLEEGEVLILMSEYLIILFSMSFRHQLKMHPFSVNMSKADYLTRVIWVSLKVHADMERVTGAGSLRYESSLAAAFTRFLTKGTASFISAHVDSRLSVLEKFVGEVQVTKLREDVNKIQQGKKK